MIQREEKKQHIPQVLLLGNGIIRSYSELALSWHELLLKIGCNPSLPENLHMPMPLEIVLRTGDSVDAELSRHHRELYGEVRTREFEEILRSLLTLGFDHILTTNYSYELEEAALHCRLVSDAQLQQMRRQTIAILSRSEEAKYRLHTYYRVGCEQESQENQKAQEDCTGPDAEEANRSTQKYVNRIWHIHGEAADPESMILGHYYYGNLLSLCREHIRNCERAYERLRPEDTDRRVGRMYLKSLVERAILSWVDAFLLGDVYVLGFGYDFSEMDLWWLLNAKKKLSEPGGNPGRMYYYRPDKEEAFDVKQELMREYGAEVLDCGARETGSEEADGAMYRQFYKDAIEDIRRKMGGKEV